MDSLTADLLRAVAVGVTIHLLMLHTWLARRGREASKWVALWALIALISGVARLVQMRATDPAVALSAIRLFGATAPLQIWALACAVRAMTGRRWSGLREAAFAGFNFAWAASFVLTPWFLTGTMKSDSEFGRSFFGGVPGPAIATLGVYVVVAVAWALRALAGSAIDRRERVALSLGLGAYAAIGVLSVLSAMELSNLPLLLDLGTIVLAFGFSYVLVVRQHALELNLERMVEKRTRDLATGEKIFRDLVENAPVGIVACTATGRVTMLNAHMWRVLGSPAALPISALGNLLTHPDAVRGGGAAVARRVLETGETSTSEVSLESRWRGTRALRVIASALRGPDGAIGGALLLVEDVTERKAVQQHLRDSQKLEAMGRLAAGIAHEVNNPLTCLRANLSVLRDDLPRLRSSVGDPDPQRASQQISDLLQLLDESSEAVDRASAIVRDMQEFAHPGRVRDDSFELISLAPLLRNCVRIAETHSKMRLAIEERYAELPLVKASASQLRQVFLNLLVNAVQAAGGGGRVSLSAACEADCIVVRVTDDGPGIPPEERGRIFEPFFTTKPLGEGTGLGLSISREIVHAHDGEIRVTSEPGEGATFEVRLPLERS